MQGLEVYNDSNTLQISSEFIDMALMGTRTVAAKTARSSAMFYAVMGYGSDYISPNEPNTAHSNITNGAGTVYDFTLDYLDVASKEKLGLELYGSDGKVYYNSNYKSVSVIDRFSLNITRSTTGVASTGVVIKNYGAKKVAVFMIRDFSHFVYQQYDYFTVVYTASFNQDSSGTLRVKALGTADIGADATSAPADETTLEFLVIDVTNY